MPDYMNAICQFPKVKFEYLKYAIFLVLSLENTTIYLLTFTCVRVSYFL